MSMFVGNVHVYWQCPCLLAMSMFIGNFLSLLAISMFIGNVHVYCPCPCLLAMSMFIGNVHVYWQCLCLLAMSIKELISLDTYNLYKQEQQGVQNKRKITSKQQNYCAILNNHLINDLLPSYI